MVVSFPFTFSFSVPGLANPFSSVPLSPTHSHSSVSIQQGRGHEYNNQFPNGTARPQLNSNPSPDIHYSTSASASYSALPNTNTNTSNIPTGIPQLGRPSKNLKRGWEPAFMDPRGQSTTSLTVASTSGYLDTRSEYEIASSSHDQYQYQSQGGGRGEEQDEDEESDGDRPPPTKRRRGLAGSIVNTAVSAALIGTAVGLTVYRLWRNRGKDSESKLLTSGEYTSASMNEQIEASGSNNQLPPPPPYQESDCDWEYSTHTQHQQTSSIPQLPTTPRRKAHHQRHSYLNASAKRSARKTKIPKARGTGGAVAGSSGMGSETQRQPEFDFGLGGTAKEEEGGDQMDWIGGKLAQLIEEGKKALSREIVVMSDSKEDEVDDGSGAWVEEDDRSHSPIRRNTHNALNSSVSSSSSRIAPTGTTTTRSRSNSVRRSIIPQHSQIPVSIHTPRKTPTQTPTRPTYNPTATFTPPMNNSSSNSNINNSGGSSKTRIPSYTYNRITPSNTPSRPKSNSITNTHSHSSVWSNESIGSGSGLGSANTSMDTNDEWQSEELKESMRRAREAILAGRSKSRNGGGSGSGGFGFGGINS